MNVPTATPWPLPLTFPRPAQARPLHLPGQCHRRHRRNLQLSSPGIAGAPGGACATTRRAGPIIQRCAAGSRPLAVTSASQKRLRLPPCHADRSGGTCGAPFPITTVLAPRPSPSTGRADALSDTNKDIAHGEDNESSSSTRIRKRRSTLLRGSTHPRSRRRPRYW